MDDKKLKKQKDEGTDQKVDGIVQEEEAQEEIDDAVENEDTVRIQQLEDQLKRAVADYRNLENRIREEKLEYVRFANKNLLEALLPAFDTLILAGKYTEDENLKITVKHILEVLKQAGIERVETVGQKYNPSTMEAIEVVDGDIDTVVEEAQPGFLLNGKTIRPARVKVGGKTVE